VSGEGQEVNSMSEVRKDSTQQAGWNCLQVFVQGVGVVEFSTQIKSIVLIEAKRSNGRTASWSLAYDSRAVEFKVIVPRLGSRIKERHD